VLRELFEVDLRVDEWIEGVVVHSGRRPAPLGGLEAGGEARLATVDARWTRAAAARCGRVPNSSTSAVRFYLIHVTVNVKVRNENVW